jgi:hypothetical protein
VAAELKAAGGEATRPDLASWVAWAEGCAATLAYGWVVHTGEVERGDWVGGRYCARESEGKKGNRERERRTLWVKKRISERGSRLWEEREMIVRRKNRFFCERRGAVREGKEKRGKMKGVARKREEKNRSDTIEKKEKMDGSELFQGREQKKDRIVREEGTWERENIDLRLSFGFAVIGLVWSFACLSKS